MMAGAEGDPASSKCIGKGTLEPTMIADIALAPRYATSILQATNIVSSLSTSHQIPKDSCKMPTR